MPNSLKGSEYLYNNPKARAEDMMNAFKDKEIKAIISNIGGEETIRILPFIEYDVIKNNPKILLGFSDTTINHFMCYKAGLISYYGPSVLTDFSENVQMHDYTVNSVIRTLFKSDPIGEIVPNTYWTDEFLPWENVENNNIKRKLNEDTKGYELLQGKGSVEGKLIGGCVEVLDWIRGTELWPSEKEWENSILFLETSEEKPKPSDLRFILRSLVTMGVFKLINGTIVGKPCGEEYYEEYKEEYIRIAKEAGREDMPILYNMNFGHNAPFAILPYGVSCKIDCETKRFFIIENGVED